MTGEPRTQHSDKDGASTEKLHPCATCTGGMLSDEALRDIIVVEGSDRYLELFRKRDWKNLDDEFKEKRAGLVILPYNALNLTPFSYDLSIGDELWSVQKLSYFQFDPSKEASKEYNLDPAETVVVLTEELVAISRYHSATVWPRFNLVRQGVIQSMVKIDPTWHGKLAVVITNSSPAVIKLRAGQPFATLILFGLAKPSEVDLWVLEDLPWHQVEVPKHVAWILQNALREETKLSRHCRLIGEKLEVRGIKRSHIDLLKSYSQDPAWVSFLTKDVAEGWAEKKHKDTGRRMVAMEALGMCRLKDIVSGQDEGARLHAGDIIGRTCDSEALMAAAEQYGKPFDLVAMLPETVMTRIEEDAFPRIEAQVEDRIQPRIIMLMFAVLGFLSLIVSSLALLQRFGAADLIQAIAVKPAFSVAVLVLGLVTVLSLFGLEVVHVRLHRRTALSPWRDRLLGELRTSRAGVAELDSKLKNLQRRYEELESKLKSTGSEGDVREGKQAPNGRH
jgi:deoxycytidine triphosphate deaminase